MDPQLAEYRRRMAARARGAGGPAGAGGAAVATTSAAPPTSAPPAESGADFWTSPRRLRVLLPGVDIITGGIHQQNTPTTHLADAATPPTSSTTPTSPGPRPLLDLALPTYQWALLLVLALFVARNSSIGLLFLLCGLLLVAAAIYTQLLDATARETVTTFLFRTQFAVREVVEDVVVPPGDAFATHFALEPMAEAEAEGGGGVSRRRKNLVRLPVYQWLLLLLATCFLFGAGVLGWLTAFGLLYTFMRKNGARKLQRWWASASSTSSR